MGGVKGWRDALEYQRVQSYAPCCSISSDHVTQKLRSQRTRSL